MDYADDYSQSDRHECQDVEKQKWHSFPAALPDQDLPNVSQNKEQDDREKKNNHVLPENNEPVLLSRHFRLQCLIDSLEPCHCNLYLIL